VAARYYAIGLILASGRVCVGTLSSFMFDYHKLTDETPNKSFIKVNSIKLYSPNC
jgi:hypothetical protein